MTVSKPAPKRSGDAYAQLKADIVNKSISCSKMSTMYIHGVSVSIFGSVSEFDVQKRKGWIEQT